MKLDLESLNYTFTSKPLLIGGMAKEYHGIRKSGKDIDLVVTEGDYNGLAEQYPDNLKELYGDLGVVTETFEIWKSIMLFDYEFLSQKAIEKEDYLIISLDKLLFLTALAMDNEKYEKDLRLTVDRIKEIQYKDTK